MKTYLNATAEEYHAHNAVSSGGIRCYTVDGPMEYHARYIARTKEAGDSESKRLGRAFHAAMESPGTWRDSFVIVPELIGDDEFFASVIDDLRDDGKGKLADAFAPGQKLNMRKEAHKRYHAKILTRAILENKDMISAEKLSDIAEMVGAVNENPAANALVSQSKPELAERACVNIHGLTGLEIKALADIDLGDIIVDFKTTRETTARGFARQAEKMGYKYQAAHYLDVFEAHRFVLITVTSSPPYESMVYEFTPSDINHARESNNRTLDAIKGSIEMNVWHADLWGAPNPIGLQMGEVVEL